MLATPKPQTMHWQVEYPFSEDDRIYWICPICDDDGIIDGWHGLIWDVSDYNDEDRVVH